MIGNLSLLHQCSIERKTSHTQNWHSALPGTRLERPEWSEKERERRDGTSETPTTALPLPGLRSELIMAATTPPKIADERARDRVSRHSEPIRFRVCPTTSGAFPPELGHARRVSSTRRGARAELRAREGRRSGTLGGREGRGGEGARRAWQPWRGRARRRSAVDGRASGRHVYGYRNRSTARETT